MFHAAMSSAISDARTLARMDELSRTLWQAHACGAVKEDQAQQLAVKGVCGLCIDAIAARAGVSARWAQKAIRLAESDGLLVIQERRHEDRRTTQASSASSAGNGRPGSSEEGEHAPKGIG